MAQLLDGKATSAALKDQIKVEVDKILEAGKRAPHLAAVLVGNDGASHTYVNAKVKACEQVGFTSTLIKKEADISEEELLNIVESLNNDVEIDGFIVQLPLPKHIDEQKVTEAISPLKDVDGFHPVNVGKMSMGLPSFLPATPMGIMKLLEFAKIDTSGKNCVVLGRSNIVGTPISILMSRNTNPGNATVTMAHSRSQDIASITKQADIIIAAVGKPNFVTKEMVKEGAIIVDVGIHRIEDASKKSGFRLIGDVKFDEVEPLCSYITPVPGGVGPMTIASLMFNTLQAYKG